jgi:hypothetical protein
MTKRGKCGSGLDANMSLKARKREIRNYFEQGDNVMRPNDATTDPLSS